MAEGLLCGNGRDVAALAAPELARLGGAPLGEGVEYEERASGERLLEPYVDELVSDAHEAERGGGQDELRQPRRANRGACRIGLLLAHVGGAASTSRETAAAPLQSSASRAASCTPTWRTGD